MSSDLLARLQQFNLERQLFSKGDCLILGFSGGLDSVVLAHLLKGIGQTLVLAHCNFQLRGAESDRDEAFVRLFAEEEGLPLFAERFNTARFATENKCSIQVAARQLRYGFFENLRQGQLGVGKRVLVATAHHGNDSVETFLFNLFRGAGIDGMQGIPVKNGHIIRPLLFAKRPEIEAYAREKSLAWVEDSSNAKHDYTRNYIRHQVLPTIESSFPAVVDTLSRTMERMQAVSSIYHHFIRGQLQKWAEKEGVGQKLPVLRLLNSGQPGAYIWEWIKPFGFTEGQVKEVEKLCNATNASYVASATHRVIRNRAWLLLVPVEQAAPTFFVVDSLPARVSLPNGKTLIISPQVPFDHAEGIPMVAIHKILPDASQARLPFMVRPWKPGDYFYPLGLAKKKKVARFLIDQKVSPVEKRDVWVVESEMRIIWVIGYRLDDRFKISGSTKNVFEMVLK